MLETSYYILRVGETFDGRLCSEIREGDIVLDRSFFRPPKLFPRQKKIALTPHIFLPNSALRCF
ncbi:MAG: hypothetical protein UT31_C0037G0004 [Parcubacteria group bacterium GW2011_GWF2_39_13b]|nr:MAG: hypothetical protein UT31_C0037G0004 [Parcubacteria group bacterium GW2011_GWF2_39_13b]